jgi:phage terminase large subunit-like protein
MPSWSTACPDWRERILSGRSLIPDLPLFRPEAERALRIFKRLRLPDVVGNPTMAQACGEWFFPVVEALFGAYDPAANRRMIQEFFLLIPKKNSKSSNGGAVMVVALMVNRRPEAEFLLVAPTKEIADIAFKQASGTIRLDPVLTKLFHIQRHLRLITYRTNGARLQIKAADTDVITGGKQLGAMIDETHVFAAKARAADVFVELRGALAARPDGFLFQTTTQSKAPPAGVFATELSMARDVRDGKISLPLLPILYELPHEMSKDGGWKDRRYWPLVNPNMGRSVNPDFLAREILKAEGDPAQTALIASQHFNVEIGLALQSNAWAGAAYWQANAEPGLTLDDLIARCEVVCIGIDGGGLDDLLGLAVIGRIRDSAERTEQERAKTAVKTTEISGTDSIIETNTCFEQNVNTPANSSVMYINDLAEVAEEGTSAKLAEVPHGKWLHYGRAWCHRRVLELRKDIAPALLDYEKDGDLTITDRVGDDLIEVAAIVRRVMDAGLLPEKNAIGVDPAGIGEILQALADLDIDTSPEAQVVRGIPQGWLLNGAIKSTERKLAGGDLKHCGQRLMAWAVGNAKVEPVGNAIRITKQASGTAKIDPVMALLDAAALMAMNPGPARQDVRILILDAV